jgi:hypothetical protein
MRRLAKVALSFGTQIAQAFICFMLAKSLARNSATAKLQRSFAKNGRKSTQNRLNSTNFAVTGKIR